MIPPRAARGDPPALLRRALAHRHHRRRTLGVHHDTVRRALIANAASTPARRSARARSIPTRPSSPRRWSSTRACAPRGSTRCSGSAATPARPSRCGATCAPCGPPRAPRPTSGSTRCPASKGRSTGATSAPSRSATAAACCRASCSCCRGRAPSTPASPSTRRSRASSAATSKPSPRSAACPAILLYDNLKSVVLERVGEHIRFHPRAARARRPLPLRAPALRRRYRGNEKGKVERMIQYLRHSFFAARRFTVARRPQRPARPVDRRDRAPRPRARRSHRPPRRRRPGRGTPRLLPAARRIPSPATSCASVVSGKTPVHPLRRQRLLHPAHAVRRPLTLVASRTAWSALLDGATEVARHARSYDRGQRVEDRGAPRRARRARSATPTTCAAAIASAPACPHADAFLDALARRGEPLAPHTTALAPPARPVRRRPRSTAALADALARGAVSALGRRPSPRPARPRPAARRRRSRVVLPADPRVRDLRVTPHRLADYDALLTPRPRRRTRR